MAFDVEAAKAEGYSDEDIEKYLASIGQTMTGQPIPATPAVAPQVPMDRSNEYMAMGGAGALGAGAALAGKALILDPIRQGISAMMSPGPVAPSPAPAARPIPQAAPAVAQQTSRQAMADKVRQIAAQRIAGFGAAVPAGVAAGGAAATGIAGGQMAAMTPEQRKAYYDSMMMGAMSGDAGLAAAIMNRGQ